MNPRSVVALLATFVIAALGAGCTELRVLPMPPTGMIEGIPYALPQKTLVISTEHELRDCSLQHAADTSWWVRLRVRSTITVVPDLQVDQTARYYIPYSALRHWYKSTDLTVESHDNGTLKSLSLTQEDKTGEAIAAGIGSLVKLSSIGAAIPAQEPVAMNLLDTRRRLTTYCAPAAVDALNAVKALEVKIETLTKEMAKEIGAPAAAPAQAEPASTSLVKGRPRAAAAAASAVVPPNESNQRTLDELTQEVALIKAAKLVFKQVTNWTPRRDPQRSTSRLEITLYPRSLVDERRWLTSEGMKLLPPGEIADGQLAALLTHVTLDTAAPISSGQEDVAPDANGLFVRLPVRALMRLCSVRCPDKLDGDVSAVLKAQDIDIPQLGQRVVVPLRNALFQSQTISLMMTPDGVITKSGIITNAAGTAALTSLSANLDTLQKSKADRDKAKEDARQATLNAAKAKANQVAADNQAVLDCLKAQKDLAALGGTVTGTCQ